MSKYQVSDDLLNALIKQETGGNNNAISAKGAQGITQVMPATASNPGYGVDPLQGHSIEDYKKFSKDYLGAMLDKYNGSLPHALAAYNAGPGAVDKAGGIPNIPETQNYVKSILSSLNPVKSANASEIPDPKEWIKQYRLDQLKANTNQNNPENTPPDPKEWIKQYRLEHGTVTEPMPISTMATKALENAPESMGKNLFGAAQTILHPINSAQSLLDITNGALQKVLPNTINSIMPNSTKGNIEKANMAGEYFKNRLGGIENIKNTIATDPIGFLADASTLLGGAGALAKLGNANKLADILSATSNISNPMTIAGKAIGIGGNAVKGVGNLSATIIGNLGTHTGSESLRQAALSGLEGGSKAEGFLANLRNSPNAANPIDEMKLALAKMRSDRGTSYRQGMEGVSQDTQVLPFSSIDNAVQNAMKIGSYKGESISKTASNVKDQINTEINRWKNLPANDFHTAEGMDALKKSIGDIRDNTEFGTSSRVIADSVYNAIKKEIVKQVPEYAKTMKDYEEATNLTKEIERTLSIGDKAAADTAMRKLLSLTRNNVNTNYGNRLALVDELMKNGSPNIMSDISGKTLNTWTPRGLGGLIASGTLGAGVAAHSPLTIPALIAQSPRAMGETAYYLGKAGKFSKEFAGNKLTQQIAKSITPLSSIQNLLRQPN